MNKKSALQQDSPLISVIIVSYNTREMTLKCLHTLYDNLDGLSVEVWVVDNASTDGSVAAIADAFPQVRVIANASNTGFGAANNQAMQQARGEYFLLLNSDAFVKPGAVSTLVEYLRNHPHVAAVGPQLLNADGSLQRSCWKFPSPARAWLEGLGIAAMMSQHPTLGDYYRWAHDTERLVDFVIGACLLIRRQVYEQVGGFDENFFMYAEETDWQRRIRSNGWQIGFTPAAQVIHLGGASGAADAARINEHFYRGTDLYQRKHYGFLGLFSYRLASIVASLARALLWCVMLWFAPRKRNTALPKARLNLWLLWRQMTRWNISTK